MKRAPGIVLTSDECATLESWARGRSTPVRLSARQAGLMERARIVLAAANGMRNKEMAVELGMPPFQDRALAAPFRGRAAQGHREGPSARRRAS